MARLNDFDAHAQMLETTRLGAAHKAHALLAMRRAEQKRKDARNRFFAVLCAYLLLALIAGAFVYRSLSHENIQSRVCQGRVVPVAGSVETAGWHQCTAAGAVSHRG